MIFVIGRGHSGTRAISETLSRSGTFMGSPLNDTWDLIPPGDLYRATLPVGKLVRYLGNATWDFSAVHSADVDPDTERYLTSYDLQVFRSCRSTCRSERPAGVKVI